MSMLTDAERAARLVCFEWAMLQGERPRHAGCNARLGEHGRSVRVPIARITTSDGARGFGRCSLRQQEAALLVGRPLGDFFDTEGRICPQFRSLEYPLWDLIGQIRGQSVYSLLRSQPPSPEGYRVPCYDTSLYMDDLHLEDDEAAAALIAQEALQGYERGHRAFKIKVGRGAMHMPLEEGTRRDIRVVHAVREAVGSECLILLDANNGYNLNLTKRVLEETAEVGIYWMEEPFHEDPRLYANLKAWLNQRGLDIRIADGEGDASSHLLDWAREGLIDVVQRDIFHPGFEWWLQTGQQLDSWGVGSAPHHYGGHYGNYAACHLAGAIHHFQFAEWDEASTPGLDPSAYAISEGMVHVPERPGFGLQLEEPIFAAAVREHGFVCRDSQT